MFVEDLLRHFTCQASEYLSHTNCCDWPGYLHPILALPSVNLKQTIPCLYTSNLSCGIPANSQYIVAIWIRYLVSLVQDLIVALSQLLGTSALAAFNIQDSGNTG